MSQTLAQLFSSDLTQVARVELRHVRRRRFRWWFLLELAVALTFLACLVPVVMLIAALTEGEALLMFASLEGVTGRVFYRRHELRVRLISGDGTAEQVVLHPVDPEEGAAMVGAVLAAADREGLVVLQSLGPRGGEVLERWYGGQPLLQPPEAVDLGRARRVVAASGLEVEEVDEAFVLRSHEERLSRGRAFLLRVVSAPFLIWAARGRAYLTELGHDAAGRPASHEVVLAAGDLSVWRRRGPAHATCLGRVDRADLLGIAWSARLGFDDDVRREPPALRLVTARCEIDVPLSVDEVSGEAVRDLLVAAAQARWAEAAHAGRLAHCPHCATRYAFAEGARCPSCGAPPTQLEALV